MANYTIGEHLRFATKDRHHATDWEVALDPDFENLIDSSYKNEESLVYWNSPLPKIGEDGYYSDEDIIYARARLWFGLDSSNWLVLSDNQNYQAVVITEDGKEPIYTDSTAINMQ